MRQATEKILVASTEAQKPVVIGQLEAIGKRIQMLESEVEVYKKASLELSEPYDGDVRSYSTKLSDNRFCYTRYCQST